jgi:hypothetical protein
MSGWTGDEAPALAAAVTEERAALWPTACTADPEACRVRHMLEVATAPSAPVPAPSGQPAAAHDTTFHDVLSALNPLQYLPVIGTIYRALTGDDIAEPIRRVGSAIASALIGGPVGLVVNLAMVVAEKASGLDLDHAGQALIASVSGSGAAAAATPPPAEPAAVAETRQAWSRTQLAAYGIATRADGMPENGTLSDADLLNSLELGRIRGAQAAYTQAMVRTG